MNDKLRRRDLDKQPSHQSCHSPRIIQESVEPELVAEKPSLVLSAGHPEQFDCLDFQAREVLCPRRKIDLLRLSLFAHAPQNLNLQELTVLHHLSLNQSLRLDDVEHY